MILPSNTFGLAECLEAHPERGGLHLFGGQDSGSGRTNSPGVSRGVGHGVAGRWRRLWSAKLHIAARGGRSKRGWFTPFGIENHFRNRFPGAGGGSSTLLEMAYYKCSADIEIFRDAELGAGTRGIEASHKVGVKTQGGSLDGEVGGGRAGVVEAESIRSA